MSTLIELCGVARGGAILTAVRQIVSEERKPTPAAVDELCQRLPGWEAADDAEVQAAMEMVDAQADQHVASLAQEAEPPPPADEASPAPEPPAVSREDATEALRLARIKLANDRAALIGAQNRRQTTRTRLSASISAWQRRMPRQSFQSALSDVVKTQQIVKAQGGGKVRGVPGPSNYDKERFFSGPAYGDARDFVRKMQRHGGNRRGGLPLSYARGPVDTQGVSKMPLPRTNSGRNREV